MSADAVLEAEGYSLTRQRAERCVPTGVEEQGVWTAGSPGTWEAQRSPLEVLCKRLMDTAGAMLILSSDRPDADASWRSLQRRVDTQV